MVEQGSCRVPVRPCEPSVVCLAQRGSRNCLVETVHLSGIGCATRCANQRLTLYWQARSKIDEVSNAIGDSVGSQRNVESPAGMTDQYIARLQDFHNRITAVLEGRRLGTPLAVAGQVYGKSFTSQALKFG
jgi:hypothetical protein